MAETAINLGISQLACWLPLHRCDLAYRCNNRLQRLQKKLTNAFVILSTFIILINATQDVEKALSNS